MDLGLRGKKAIVTGATKGIGRAIVELLAAEGADIGFCARNEDEVAEATIALKQRDVNVVGGSVNVRDADAYKAWLESTAEALGGCESQSARDSASDFLTQADQICWLSAVICCYLFSS
jgi:NAD(P)-dependent dehydrogenase (short-subunit alcohol dehydrogenase family)